MIFSKDHDVFYLNEYTDHFMFKPPINSSCFQAWSLISIKWDASKFFKDNIMQWRFLVCPFRWIIKATCFIFNIYSPIGNSIESAVWELPCSHTRTQSMITVFVLKICVGKIKLMNFQNTCKHILKDWTIHKYTVKKNL